MTETLYDDAREYIASTCAHHFATVNQSLDQPSRLLDCAPLLCLMCADSVQIY